MARTTMTDARAGGRDTPGTAVRQGRTGGASGIGRVLVVVYAILALAAIGRSGVQLLTKFDEAPLAYVLSAAAAVIYLIATIGLVAKGRVAHRIAAVAIAIEFVGVLVVGAVSSLAPELFPADTVWSGFGRGYLYIPLVLPIFGIAWLESRRNTARTTDVRHH